LVGESYLRPTGAPTSRIADSGFIEFEDGVANDYRAERPPVELPANLGDASDAHLLFDPLFWRQSLEVLGIQVGPDPTLTDYVHRPETWPAAPHPLFDPAHYAAELARLGLAPNPSLPPLADMLERAELVSSHYLFAADFYALQAELDGKPLEDHPLLHYVRAAGRTGWDPHPLFDTDFYLAGCGQEVPAGTTPLEHFLREGAQQARDPSPLFSQRHYRQQLRVRRGEKLDALKHYLELGGQALLDPHPRFEAGYYAATHPDCLDGRDTPLAHYVRSWLTCGFRCPPWGTGLSSRHGRGSGAAPVDVILVSHELSMTGAPKILLKIAEHLVTQRGLNLLVLAARDGPLLEAFREWACVLDLSALADGLATPTEMAKAVCESIRGGAGPRCAIVNTACVSEIGEVVAAAGIPMVTLVHELASSITAAEFKAIYDASALVIYPAEFVRDEAHRTYELPIAKSRVMPQGLLDPRYGEGDRLTARADLLAEIGAPDDAYLVLACGTLDLRKGIDIFVRVAAASRASRRSGRPLHFVWVGGGDEGAHTPFWYARQDVVRGGLEDCVHFLGGRANTAPYFLGCDALVVTSRMDPFPCIVHEAMACSKPVVVFDNAGGAPEALAEGAGVVVPYGDVAAMARALGNLADDAEAQLGLGARALARVRERYCFGDYVEKIVAALDGNLGVQLADRSVAAGATDRGRVLFALGGWRPDPITTFTERLLRGLQARGFAPEIIFTGALPDKPQASTLPSVPYRFLLSSLSEQPGFVSRCHRLERGVRAAAPAIYVHDLDPVGAAIVPVLPETVGVLGLLHGAEAEHLEQAGRLGRYRQRTVATTPTIARRVASAFPEQAASLVELPRGVTQHSAAAERTAKGPLQIVCIAPPPERNDLLHFLRSVFHRSDRGDRLDYVVTFLGAPPEQEKLRLLFDAESAAGSVRFATWRAEAQMIALLRQTDVLLTLDSDIGALDLAEVMSLGVIVVAAFGRPPQWLGSRIADNVNGYTVRLGRPEACREILARLVGDDSLRAGLRRAALAAGNSEIVDIEQVCDRYADLLDSMLADLRSGRYAKPSPVYAHPVFHGLSLPSTLLVSSDTLPKPAVYDGPAAAAERPHPDGSHPGWASVFELCVDSKITAYGGARLYWRDGELEVVKAEGDGGFTIGLERNPSHLLMARVALRSDEGGTASLFSRTITEPEFTSDSRIDHGFDAGCNGMKVTIKRSASICALRLRPSQAAGRFHVGRLAVFAPALYGWDEAQAPVLPLATLVDFTMQGDAEEYLAGGWYAPEGNLRWCHGGDGRVRFSLGGETTESRRLWVLCRTAGAKASGGLDFDLRRPDGSTHEAWTFADDGWILKSINLADVPSNGEVEIQFHTDQAGPLEALGYKNEKRWLSLAIRNMALFPASASLADIEANFRDAAAGVTFRVDHPEE
jgi:glycosyltransferase involved in cell wall biosynthesis